jgi:hypothetical protein
MTDDNNRRSPSGPPPRDPGSPPLPEPNLHVLQAYRNWLIAGSAMRYDKKPGSEKSKDRIGQSPSVSRLLETLGQPAQRPPKPPMEPGAADESGINLVAEQSASLINENLGYGETVTDSVSVPHGKSLESEVLVSRRTRSGLQPLPAAPLSPPSATMPPASLKMPKVHPET